VAFLITGPQGAGKTTVAEAVARSFDRGVHVEGDAFRRFVVAGRAEMDEDGSDEALAQLRLRYALAHHAAQKYEHAGFTVVVEDVVAGTLLREVAPGYAHVVVLFPPEDVVAARAGRRHAPWVYRLFAEATPRLGTWIDNSRLTPEETAAAILRA
jgi:predicted kinase